MKVENIEAALVCVIVSIQLYVFTRTLIQIGVFRNIIPMVTSLKISKVFVPVVDLERLPPKEILAKIKVYKETFHSESNTNSWKETKINEISIPTGVFYMPAPNSDGSFNKSSASEFYVEGASMYRFTKTGINSAKFYISGKEIPTNLALKFPDKFIDPVCAARNAYNPKALRIETFKVGEAELVNDKWVTISKALISYETNSTTLFYSNELDAVDIPTFTENGNKDNSIEKAEVNILESEVKTNHVFDNILFSVNNYLIRNRGAASDFNLIKDIVERNTNAVEEDINLSIGVPLYLGLMGTMMGIVIGLFNMPDLGAVLDTKAKDVMLNDGIALLIGGVKIAMIASFSGLMLTIINSGWIFKGSRSLSEARKNDFYTFVQIELLPIINQGLASTLESLQRNLLKFNSEFTTNLSGLTGIFDSSRKAIKEQKELLDSIDKTKVAEMTRYNVKVLQQLDISVVQFEKFNRYMTDVNLFVDNSQRIVSRTNELLSRTDNFKVIAENLDSKLTQSQQLLEFLSAHFSKLEEHKEFTSNAVADVGHAISSSFKDLQEHIQNSSEAVKQFTVDELEALKKALSESKTNLSNLEHLATLNKDVSQFKNSAASQGERIKQQLEDLNKNMARSIAILEEIEHSSLTHKAKGFSTSIANLFKTKK